MTYDHGWGGWWLGTLHHIYIYYCSGLQAIYLLGGSTWGDAPFAILQVPQTMVGITGFSLFGIDQKFHVLKSIFYILPCWFQRESITTGNSFTFVPGGLSKGRKV